MRDYYEVLGLSRNASDDDIKKAYRRLAMEHHPDRNDGDKNSEERFKEAAEAYEALRNPETRARYDHYGHAGLKGGVGAGTGGFHPFDLSEALNLFMNDFGGLDAFFGGGRRKSRRDVRQGQDVRIALRLSLSEVALGTKRKVKLRTLSVCEKCDGSGGSAGEGPAICPTCGGSGEIRQATQSILGSLISVQPCRSCAGEGSVVRNPCEVCEGDGRTRVEKTIEIEVPAGVSENNYLTLKGKGQAGVRGGSAGDLVVAIEVQDDPRFERDGDDLVHDLLVSFSQAALGADFVIDTPLGEEKVTLKGGTQSGSVTTLEGKGLPNVNRGGRGDLHIRIQVWTPDRLSDEQEEVFLQLANVEGDPPSEESFGRRVWNRVKEAFS